MGDWVERSCRSTDGTVIGYRQLGSGPALVLLHGGMQGGRNFSQLGELLADRFTVILPDRRGRGLSGPQRLDHSIEAEIDDLGAVLAATGAQDVFALSAGAIVTLWGALRLPIARMALYEPPLVVGEPKAFEWVRRYDRENAAGRLAAAMVTVLMGTSDRRDWFTALPRFILTPMMAQAMRGTDDEAAALRQVVPTMHYDMRMIASTAGRNDELAAITSKALLMGGANSAPFLTTAVDRLAGLLPKADRVTLQGIGHLAADNVGKPALVAEGLRLFFA